MLSRMAALAEALAAGFQAQGVAALAAGDLDRAGRAEAGFSSLFLGIRRAIALKARLRRQREEARHHAEFGRNWRQDEKNDRRRAVAKRISQAIAIGRPEARERLTADLWDRLTEDERIDADLADTALPVEVLVRRLCRDIGLSRRALAAALDPDRKAAAPQEQGAGLVFPVPPPPPQYDYTPGVYRTLPAADLGLPGDTIYNLNTTTGEVFDPDGKLFRTLPKDEQPPDPGGAAPPERAAPPTPDPQPPPPRDLPSDRRQWTGADWAEHRRRESERNAQWRRMQMLAHIHRHG